MTNFKESEIMEIQKFEVMELSKQQQLDINGGLKIFGFKIRLFELVLGIITAFAVIAIGNELN